MSALEPRRRGHIVRDGVRVAWELFGDGNRTIFLLPTWAIVNARQWRFQVPYLARHARVLVMDGRGSGGSDRPSGFDRYADREFAADALAAMDASDTAEAALVSVWAGSRWALLVMDAQPERVSAAVFIAPTATLTADNTEGTKGRATAGADQWRRDYRGFLERHFSRVFPGPHSIGAVEECVAMGLDASPETLIASAMADQLDHEGARALAKRVRCPVLVVHGELDEISPSSGSQALAEATSGRLLTLSGSGHAPHMSDPVGVNLALRDFLLAPAQRIPEPRTSRTRLRALLVTSPIGLGHVRRDIAIARELRSLRPGLEIDWLAQHPVTVVLEERAERIHPASGRLLCESPWLERESQGHRLHVFEVWRHMDEVLLHNFMVFNDVVEQESYDLWIGDEAWEIDQFLFANPSLKRAPFVWMTDFVGSLPMPDHGQRELLLTADSNAEMLERLARTPALRDLSIFLGRPEDVTTDRFGPGLPRIRDWTRAHFRVS